MGMAEDNLHPSAVTQIESHGRLTDAVERRAKIVKAVEVGFLGVLFFRDRRDAFFPRKQRRENLGC